MDIGSKTGYPSSSLSNFSPHPFEIDGIQCNSMEGFLQGLKFESEEMQKYVCTLVGIAAKKKGKNKKSETVLTTQEFCSRLTYLRDHGKLPINQEIF